MGGILQPLLGIGSISSPNQIAGLQLWYDASASNLTNFDPAPTDGGLVQRWRDKLGNGRNADQSVNSKKPTWQANQQNGQGALLFDGTTDILTLNPIGSWALSQPGVTMFVVMKATTLSGERNICQTNTNGYNFYWSTNWGIEFAGGNAISTIPGDTTNYHIMTAVLDGTQTNPDITVQNNLRLKFRYNRVQQSLTFSTNVNTATSAAATGLNVGADGSVGGANFFAGYLGEMIIYTQTLTLAQINTVESFLTSKWGL
jgi:hypothetical protein